MFGMSAKDRMAMFENKSSTPKKGGPSKKIGKLNIGNNKKAEEPTKVAPPRKSKVQEEKKDEKENKQPKPVVGKPSPADKKVEKDEKKKESSAVPAPKPEEKPLAKKDVVDKPAPKTEEKPAKLEKKEEKVEKKKDVTERKEPTSKEKPVPQVKKVEKVEQKKEAAAPKTENKPVTSVKKTEKDQEKKEVKQIEPKAKETPVPQVKKVEANDKKKEVIEKQQPAASKQVQAKEVNKEPNTGKTTTKVEKPKEEPANSEVSVTKIQKDEPNKKLEVKKDQPKSELNVQEKPTAENQSKSNKDNRKDPPKVDEVNIVEHKPQDIQLQAVSKKGEAVNKEGSKPVPVDAKEKPLPENAPKEISAKESVKKQEVKQVPEKVVQQKQPTVESKAKKLPEKQDQDKVAASSDKAIDKPKPDAKKKPATPLAKQAPQKVAVKEEQQKAAEISLESNKVEKVSDKKEEIQESKASEPMPEPKKRKPAQYRPVPEEFYDTLFYFSGMGTVVGSAITEGVYVPQRATKTALDSEVIDEVEEDKEKERDKGTFMIRTARTQASNIAEELRKLQLLLGGLPNFGDQSAELTKIERKPFDMIMHARYHTVQSGKEKKPSTDKPKVKNEISFVPQKPVQQWPPPIAANENQSSAVNVRPAETKPVSIGPNEKGVGVFRGMVNGVAEPSSTKLAPVENQPKQGVRPYGVHTAVPDQSSVPWQDKYGSKSVEDVRGPQPFQSEGEIPSGLKPWELSRLRGLEARGFQFAHFEPKSGADESDSFYHGAASVEVENAAVKSLAPYLVSGRSQSVDREKKLAEARYAPVSAAAFSREGLPYCDL